MEDEENQDILVDLKNFNCKKCCKFPKELTIYICQNKINNKECGFNYCSACVNEMDKCLNKECGAGKDKILINHYLTYN